MLYLPKKEVNIKKKYAGVYSKIKDVYINETRNYMYHSSTDTNFIDCMYIYRINNYIKFFLV